MTKHRLILCLTILGLLATALPAAAQSGWFWGLTYEPSIPMGDAKDFADDSFSWRGVGFEGRNWLNPDLSAGFAVSWNVFHEERDWDTISEPGRDITGNQSRDINAVPIFVNAHRYWGDTYQWRPFIGMNAGTMYTERRLDMGMYSLKQSNWHFAFAPEIGIQMPYDRLLGYVSLRWNYALEAGDVGETSYLSLRIGIGLR